MEERISKPRVFLSHSKKNIDFIDKLATDLRKCQIDPWLDTDQIRHGKSWQDSIFEYGLPTCDAVIVYFTEISIQSMVVKKEIDVALLQNLKDNNIAFLPYVSDENLRRELRPDIQALQVLEWNDKNYYLLLPRVVAEIWRSYLERMIAFAVKDERLKRTQLELELEKRNNQNNSVFTTAELAEFEFIHHAFNRTIKTTMPFPNSIEENIENNLEYNFDVDLLSVVATLPVANRNVYNYTNLMWRIRNICASLFASRFNLKVDISQDAKGIKDIPDILEELRLYGLVEGVRFENGPQPSYRFSNHIGFENVFTTKMFRYRYWLAYNKNLPEEILVKFSETPL